MLAWAVLALALAACLGRVFCGWLCPFGLLSEFVHKAGRKTGPKHGKLRPVRLTGGFCIRALVLLAGLVLAVLLGAPVLNQISLPGGLTVALPNPALPLAEAGPGKPDWTLAERAVLVVLPFVHALLILTAELIMGRRVWCRWLCPQSVLLFLAACLPFGLRLRCDLSRCECKGKTACASACSLCLDPRSARSVSSEECVHCGACVRACSLVHGGGPGALSLSWSKGKKETKIIRR